MLECASILFFTVSAFAIAVLWNRGLREPLGLAVATSVPAAASLLLAIAGGLVPSIFAVGKIVFPLNCTLPILHGALMLMVVSLARSSFGFQRPPDPLMPAMIWGNTTFLVIAVLAQFFVLTSVVLLRGGKKPAPQSQA